MIKENLEPLNLEEEVISFDELIHELGFSIKRFKIEFKKNIKEFLIKLSRTEQEMLMDAINQIPPGALAKLSDVEGLYSLKVNHFRIIYIAHKDVITIVVLRKENEKT